MEKLVQNILKKSIKNLFELELADIELAVPPKKKLWDFAFWCFPIAKAAKKSPADIASELKDFIEKNNFPEIKKLEIAWPYLNIFIARNKSSALKKLEYFLEVQSKKSEYNKTMIVDYIWANVGKPLHIGHICTPCQWQTMVNALKFQGYKVISDSHIWDWGIIFWKLISAFKKYWDDTKLAENAVDHLLELYIKITADAEKDENLEENFREEFKKLSEGDKASIAYWQMFTSESISSMNNLLARLYVTPQYNVWESFYEGIGLPKIEDYPDLETNMYQIVDELVEAGIATKNEDNSVWVEFPEESGLSSCILQKRNGTHWYLASDLACIKYRMQNWAPERIIYSVDVRQKLHFEQAFYIANQAWWLKRKWQADTQLFHAYNWFISGKEWAFSTRKGNIIKLWKVLDEAEEKASTLILSKRQDFSTEKLTELARVIWIWAIKYGYLKKKRTTDVVFDWDEFMTFEGNSGPYIQYAYVRATKILKDYSLDWEINFTNTGTYENEVALEKFEILAAKLSSFYELWWVLEETTDTMMPHLIAQYSYSLTKDFNDFYDKVRIASEYDLNMKNAYIMIVQSYAKTIENTFFILWIELPDEM